MACACFRPSRPAVKEFEDSYEVDMMLAKAKSDVLKATSDGKATNKTLQIFV